MLQIVKIKILNCLCEIFKQVQGNIPKKKAL